MKKTLYIKFLSLLFVVLGVFAFTKISQAVCEDHNVYGWGWNPHVGWISLNCDQEFDLGFGVDYGVDISGTDVSGYAWNGWGEGYWICFGETCEDHSEDYDDTIFPGSSDLSSSYLSSEIDGWAKFLGWGDDGWINLNDYGGGMNMSNFTGTMADPFDYYVVRGFISGLSMDFDSYSWNNKIGWIRWYSVCANSDSDTYGAPLENWGLSIALTSDDRDKCGGDCIDTSADCSSFVASEISGEIPEGSYYDGMAGTLNGLVLARCNLISGEINPGNIENSTDECRDLLDNDCDGLIDCADPDCGYTPTGPNGLTGNDNECGKVILEWLPGVGTSSTYCASVGDEAADEFIVYRSLSEYGCSCTDAGCYDGSSGTCVEIDTLDVDADITIASECVHDDDCYIYEDHSVIPRVEYYYWVTRRVTTEETDPVSGAVSLETVESLADDGGYFETVCYPGAEYEED